MKLLFGIKFNFADWQKRDREDFIFGGIVMVLSFAILLFLWEGFILYKESFQKKIPISPVVSAPPISSQELDETIKAIDERKAKFKKILESN